MQTSITIYKLHITSETVQAKEFNFIFVEKVYPFAVGIYKLDKDALLEGRSLREQALKEISLCHTDNYWRGYSETVQTLSMPRWAFKKLIMTFTPEQVELLKQPIDKKNVETRDGNKDGTFQLAYVEGWHVLDEANRIFGFDGWSWKL